MSRCIHSLQHYFVNEINAYTIKEELGNIVRERVDKNQKDYILREELAKN